MSEIKETDYVTIEFTVDTLKAIAISLGMSLNNEGTSENLKHQWSEIYGLLVEAVKNVPIKEEQVKREIPILVKFKVGDYSFDDGIICEKTKDKNGCNHPYKGRYYCPLKKWFMTQMCDYENMKECTSHE